MSALAALTVALALLTLMVPSFTPLAIGEETALPTYAPITLPLTDATSIDYQEKTPYAPHQDGFLPDNAGYDDDSLHVKVEKFRVHDTDCLAVWVQIASPTQLRTELNKPYPSKATAKASVIAKRVNAVLAVLSVVLFFLTQPLVWRFRFVDWWTVLFVLLCGTALAMLIWRRRSESATEEDTDEE